MVGDSSKPKSAPDPHHPSELSMPEGNTPRWAILAFLAYSFLVFLFMIVFVIL